MRGQYPDTDQVTITRWWSVSAFLCWLGYLAPEYEDIYARNKKREIDSHEHGLAQAALGTLALGVRAAAVGAGSWVTCHARPLIVCDVTLARHKLP